MTTRAQNPGAGHMTSHPHHHNAAAPATLMGNGLSRDGGPHVGALIDTDSEPGAWTDALAHSVHITVSNHIPRSDPIAAPSARTPACSIPPLEPGPGCFSHQEA